MKKIIFLLTILLYISCFANGNSNWHSDKFTGTKKNYIIQTYYDTNAKHKYQIEIIITKDLIRFDKTYVHRSKREVSYEDFWLCMENSSGKKINIYLNRNLLIPNTNKSSYNEFINFLKLSKGKVKLYNHNRLVEINNFIINSNGFKQSYTEMLL